MCADQAQIPGNATSFAAVTTATAACSGHGRERTPGNVAGSYVATALGALAAGEALFVVYLTTLRGRCVEAPLFQCGKKALKRPLRIRHDGRIRYGAIGKPSVEAQIVLASVVGDDPKPATAPSGESPARGRVHFRGGPELRGEIPSDEGERAHSEERRKPYTCHALTEVEAEEDRRIVDE